jgi:hypothetical protein
MLDVDVFDGDYDQLVGLAGGTAAACGTIGPDGGEIDDRDACFVAAGPPATLRHVTGAGEGGELIWTHATAAASEANFAQWNLVLAEAGRYEIEAYTAHAYATATRAAYRVRAAGTTTIVTIDQSALDGWQPLGAYDFAAGGDQSIHLGDNTGETGDPQLVFDAIRLTRVPDDTGSGSGATGHHGGGCGASGPDAGALLLVLGALASRRARGKRSWGRGMAGAETHRHDHLANAVLDSRCGGHRSGPAGQPHADRRGPGAA